MRVVDLFCGCGGSSLGFKEAGFEIIGALDLDEVASKTFERNLSIKPIVGDLRQTSGEKILEHYGLERGEVDVLVGCPPCQSFSYLRRTTKGNKGDPRDDLVTLFAERIEEILPRAILFENVSGITYGRGKDYLGSFLKRIEKLDYENVSDVVNAADYGVPQFRKRLICISIKKGETDEELSFPEKTHVKPEEAKELGLSEWKTVRDTIADLPSLEAGQIAFPPSNHQATDHSEGVLKIIRNVPIDGGSRSELPESLWLPCHKKLKKRKSKGAESVYGRMWWDKPAPTITSRCTTPSCGRFTHPEQDRGITPREAARLQGFKDDFEFFGFIHEITKQIGNAMPIELTVVIAKELFRLLN